MPYNISLKFIPAILMFAVAVTVSGIDIYIPSLPSMQKYFYTSEELMQFSISASIIGSSIVTIFLGQLADAVGRRQVLVIFQTLYALISLLMIFSPNIETFIFLRFLTGITATGAFTIGFVVIGVSVNLTPSFFLF
jgi:DHA1 family bicyclomycin/chloramphenicol resistance-like MFS transporter